jgi:hypothetical protein
VAMVRWGSGFTEELNSGETSRSGDPSRNALLRRSPMAFQMVGEWETLTWNGTRSREPYPIGSF